MAEQPNDNYARHDHLHDDVYTPIPTFENHVNDQLKHGGSMVPDYSTSARRAIPIDTMSRATPFTAPDNGIAVGSFAPQDHDMVIYAYINGIRTSFQSSSSIDYSLNRDCMTIPLKKGDALWFGDADGNSKQIGQFNGVHLPHWFYPYVHAANSVNGQIVYNNQPIGSVCWFDLEEAPDGWVVCNGKWYSEDGKLSSDTYTEVCTIQTPNLIGRYALGATTDIGDTVEAGLPNITGAVAKFVDNGEGHMVEGITDGAFYTQKYTEELTWWQGSAPSDNKVTVNFDASRSNEVYGKSDTVTPPSTKLLPCMKIFNAEDTLLMSVPDYSQTIDITQFPWTAVVSGVVYLSWSVDTRIAVIPTINGHRAMVFGEGNTEGGYTSTILVSKDDVLDLEFVNSSGELDPDFILNPADINDSSDMVSFVSSSKYQSVYARFTPFKNQTISNLAGDVELYFGSHTGVHKAEPSGSVTTTDPSKTVTVVKDDGAITDMQQTIDNVLVDLANPATIPPSQSGYVDIGNLRIIYGITPAIPRDNSNNQVIRIKLPQPVSTLLSVTTTIVMTGVDYDGSQIRESYGAECVAQVMRVIDDYLYVFVDGSDTRIHPKVAISYNIFTTK